MIDLYYWTTPNAHKITLFLEEVGLPYRLLPVNILKGDQFKADFLKVAPNGRVPAIVDSAPASGDEPVALFESGAILMYLAEKTGQLLPRDLHARADVLQWLFWQMAGVGPIFGQNNHFNHVAPERIPYAIDRYVRETSRLYTVLDRRLDGREFVAGNGYSIADMAIYPWTLGHERQQQRLADYPNVGRWIEAIRARPATQRAYAWAQKVNPPKSLSPADEVEREAFCSTGALTARTEA